MAAVGRLQRRADFLRVAACRRKYVAPGLILQIAPAEKDNNGLRVGFTCSRKIGNAVRRNRAKRRLRALATSLLAEHGALAHDYVLIGRDATVSRPFGDLERDLESALRRLGVWRNGPGAPAS